MKWRFLSTVAAASLATSLASAADLPSRKAPVVEPPPPSWLSTVTVDGYVEGGIAISPGQPFNKLNFGHLYTDRANWPNFNGAVLTVQRPIDSASPHYDFGFKVQGQIGEDARYNHLIGLLDYVMHDRTQIAILEANAQAHLPWTSFISQGGVDLKVGIFPTYNGAEVMYAKDNLFYSHSYIFNFGPFLHTGAMVTTHVRDWLDVYTGVTTGVNTTIGWPGDNNSGANFHGGFGLNLLEGNLKVMAIVHTGPENARQFNRWGTPGWLDIPAGCLCDPNTANRTFTNITTTWKATENLTLITDIAYNRESGWNPRAIPVFPGAVSQGADSYAIAQYASYKWNDLVTVNGRIEYYRDNKSFFVAAFPGYFDLANAIHGFPSGAIFAPGAGVVPNTGTSYLALTGGLTITPQLPQLPIITGMIIRPEVRWDTTLNGSAPFFGPNGGRKTTQGMFNMDVIIPFSLL